MTETIDSMMEACSTEQEAEVADRILGHQYPLGAVSANDTDLCVQLIADVLFVFQ